MIFFMFLRIFWLSPGIDIADSVHPFIHVEHIDNLIADICNVLKLIIFQSKIFVVSFCKLVPAVFLFLCQFFLGLLIGTLFVFLINI